MSEIILFCFSLVFNPSGNNKKKSLITDVILLIHTTKISQMNNDFTTRKNLVPGQLSS